IRKSTTWPRTCDFGRRRMRIARLRARRIGRRHFEDGCVAWQSNREDQMERDQTEAQARLQVDSPTISEAERQSRLDQLYCADRARLLLGSYRRGRANTPAT